MNAEHVINRLPKKVQLGLSGILLAASVYGCGEEATTTKPISTGTPLLPIATENLPTTTPKPTWPPGPLIPVPTYAGPTLEPIPTADPNIKCDPRLVPDTKTNTPFNAELPRDFALHVPILEYHLIDTLKSGIAQTDRARAMSSLVVSPENFHQQMKILHDAGWHTITMAELAKAWVTRTLLPNKTFVVTFDDGYRDGYINALPILEEFGFVGTFYDITGRTADATLHPPLSGNPTWLTADELYDMTEKGNDIGNHSESHSSDTTKATAGNQVYDASQYIAAVTGIWPATMAYPFGNRYTYQDAVTKCQSLIFALIQQPDQNVPAAIEDYAHRLNVPRIKIWSWVTPNGVLYMLTHLNKPIADNVKPQQNKVIAFSEIPAKKEEEMAA
jgi:peptidoglycan/xylan/chitin deacetylase (PgdA/CDA1 family)